MQQLWVFYFFASGFFMMVCNWRLNLVYWIIVWNILRFSPAADVFNTICRWFISDHIQSVDVRHERVILSFVAKWTDGPVEWWFFLYIYFVPGAVLVSSRVVFLFYTFHKLSNLCSSTKYNIKFTHNSMTMID